MCLSTNRGDVTAISNAALSKKTAFLSGSKMKQTKMRTHLVALQEEVLS